jgi:tetratricopeptide (TPR) repeat protein
VRRTGTPSKLVQLSKYRDATHAQKVLLAQDKVYEAWEASGKKRAALAREALLISADCVDAYNLLAEASRDYKERIEIYRNALAAGSRALGSNWEIEFKGLCWLALETRPVMRAMAGLAMSLQWEDELQEALSLYRRMMELNPNDNQGIRYQLAGCLYEAGCDGELEKLLSRYRRDPSAALLYTKALHQFRKSGASKPSANALQKAFKANVNVPIYLSDIVEMPEEPPATIGFGDDAEAIAYVMDHGHLWWDTDGATEWMAAELESKLRKSIDQPDLVEDVLKALRGEYDD